MFYYCGLDAATAVLRPGRAAGPELLLAQLAFFIVIPIVVSAAVATLLVTPYAFIVARDPQRRFWGETVPIWRTLAFIALCFVPLAVLMVAFGPVPLHTTHLSGAPRT